MRTLGLIGLALLVVLHQDFWLWGRDTVVLGLPIGLSYHVLICLLAALVFFVLTRSVTDDEGGVS
jgi:hypothetical protein